MFANLRLKLENLLGLNYNSAIRPLQRIQLRLERAERYQRERMAQERAIMQAAEKRLLQATREAGKAQGKARQFAELLESDTV